MFAYICRRYRCWCTIDLDYAYGCFWVYITDVIKLWMCAIDYLHVLMFIDTDIRCGVSLNYSMFLGVSKRTLWNRACHQSTPIVWVWKGSAGMDVLIMGIGGLFQDI